MAKKQIQATHTEVPTQSGAARSVTSTFTIDDSCLPSPQELEAYKRLDPAFVQHFMNVATQEQTHRHRLEHQQVDTIDKAARRAAHTQRTGMFISGFVLVLLIALTAFALWLNRPWFASISFLGTIASLAATFAQRPNK